jgi:hypothetical protein
MTNKQIVCDVCSSPAKWITSNKITYCFECVMGFGISAVTIKRGIPVTRKQINNWFTKQGA